MHLYYCSTNRGRTCQPYCTFTLVPWWDTSQLNSIIQYDLHRMDQWSTNWEGTYQAKLHKPSWKTPREKDETQQHAYLHFLPSKWLYLITCVKMLCTWQDATTKVMIRHVHHSNLCLGISETDTNHIVLHIKPTLWPLTMEKQDIQAKTETSIPT